MKKYCDNCKKEIEVNIIKKESHIMYMGKK